MELMREYRRHATRARLNDCCIVYSIIIIIMIFFSSAFRVLILIAASINLDWGESLFSFGACCFQRALKIYSIQYIYWKLLLSNGWRMVFSLPISPIYCIILALASFSCLSCVCRQRLPKIHHIISVGGAQSVYVIERKKKKNRADDK